MAKQPTIKQLHDAAVKMNKESYNPLDALRQMMMPAETAAPVPPAPPQGYAPQAAPAPMPQGLGQKRGGKVVKKAKGGSISSASKRADGCAQRGKTKGRFI